MKQGKSIFIITAIAAFSFLILTQQGCKKEDENPESGTANFNISLKSTSSSRSNYESINIDIQSASIHTSTDLEETSGWFDLETNTGIYDLLDYEAGNDTLIAFDPVLEVQTVSQIRLILGDNNTIVIDGETYDLDTPSAQTSGIKIQVHAQLQPNLSYKVVLNFDAEKSIIETGNDKYKLTPVIDATVLQID